MKKLSGIRSTDSASVDAFYRFRTSSPQTVFDSKQLFDSAPRTWDDQEVAGSGTSSTYRTNESSTRMAVSGSTAGRRVRQTFQRFNYQPGKSTAVAMSFVMSDISTGVTATLGLYDKNNGIFLQNNQGVLNVGIRSSTSGVAIDTLVPQSSWNLDPMDGTGQTGEVMDTTKTNILMIDFGWLGVGRVRIGFIIDGTPTYVHEFLNTNTTLSVVYMSSPNLPCRYEIENDGDGVASYMDHICATVMVEGGFSSIGSLGYVSNEGTQIEATTLGDIYVVCAIRLKATHIAASAILESVSVINETADDYEWMIYNNPTLSTPITFVPQTNSCLEAGVGNAGAPSTSTITAGTRVTGGYVKSGGTSGSFFTRTNTDISLILGADIAGTPNEVYLAVRPLTPGADILGSITWREFE